MTKPYRDAGFVVLMPTLRGENGQGGDYSMFLNEIDDVLAAADKLASLPYVRSDRVYVAGHSVGGTLAMLAAMTSTRFRAAAAFSGSPDQLSWSNGQADLIPFDASNIEEFRIRSPIAYATSFQCPVRLYFGASERYFASVTPQLANLARDAGLDVAALSVPGDHFSHVPESMRQSIEFFRQKE